MPSPGQYFNKIQCFCFEEQRLNPGEEVAPLHPYLDLKSKNFTGRHAGVFLHWPWLREWSISREHWWNNTLLHFLWIQVRWKILNFQVFLDLTIFRRDRILSFIFQAWLYSSHLQSLGQKCSPSILMPTTAASRANICDTWSGKRHWEHNCNQTKDAESNKQTVSEPMFVRLNLIEDGCWAIFSKVDKLPKKCHLLFQNVARKWGVCGCKLFSSKSVLLSQVNFQSDLSGHNLCGG